MNKSAANPPVRTTKKTSRRWIFAILLFVAPIGIVFFGYLSTRIMGGMRLDEAMAEADKQDPGWRMADLEASRAPYPAPAKNGIDHALRVKAAMPKGMWPEWPFPKFKDDKEYLTELRRAMDDSYYLTDRENYTLLNSEQERVLRAEVARAHDAIVLARQMPNYPHGRFAVRWSPDFVGTLLPHVQEARNIGHLMTIDSRLRAHDGDVDGALHDVKAVLYGSRAVGDEELLISQLVRMACDAVAAGVLERTLACGQASEKTLLDIQSEFEKEAQAPYFLVGIRGERAGLDYMFQNIESGELSFTQYRQILKQMGSMSFMSTKPPRNEWLVEVDIWRAYLNLRAEHAQFLHFMNQLIELAKQPTWEGAYAIEAAVTAEKERAPNWVGLINSLDLLCFAYCRNLAQLRTAYTAIAAERFRLANGRWPAALAELVPKYLDAIPLDPFDGKPLRYIRKGQTQIIYSVSKDREDQGGTFLPNATGNGSDIGFILQDVSRRRLPAKAFEFPPRSTEPPGVSWPFTFFTG